MSVEQEIERTERHLRELDEEKRIKDMDEERLRAERQLSETELLLFQMLVGYEGSMPYLIELADKPKLMGAVGKLVSKHLAKIERDFKEPRKQYRKKLVLVKDVS